MWVNRSFLLCLCLLYFNMAICLLLVGWFVGWFARWLVGWLVGCLAQMTTIDGGKGGIKEIPRFCLVIFCPAVLLSSFLYLPFCNTSSSFVSNRNQK
ncbi:hypothetical protein BKA57DRAFT_37813 [Linnemannia elongata]|nr:hypothetical protein BKA57DRAFT_37813 [Linnemannia elongata]